MQDVRVVIRNLTESARALHLQERAITLQSVRIIGELDRYNAAVNLYMTQKAFAKRIGLTPNQLWKRCQAARVFRFFPETEALVAAGETSISHIAMLSPKLTQANKHLLLTGIKGMSKRKLKALMSRVTHDGRLLEREAEVELRLTLKESELAVLDRAREVLSAGGKVPTDAELVVRALREMVERRDPLLKAKRDAERLAKKGSVTASSPEKSSTELTVDQSSSVPRASSPEKSSAEFLVDQSSSVPPASSPGKSSAEFMVDQSSSVPPASSPEKSSIEVTTGQSVSAPPDLSSKKSRRAYIPMSLRHQIWRRDEGQCTFVYPDRQRCEERMMIEIEHLEMVCRGGGNTEEDLTLRCRRHNQATASRDLGRDFMLRKIAEARTEH